MANTTGMFHLQIALWHFMDYYGIAVTLTDYAATELKTRLTATQHDCAVYCFNMHPTKVPVHKFQSCFTNCAEETVEHSCHIRHESPACSIDEWPNQLLKKLSFICNGSPVCNRRIRNVRPNLHDTSCSTYMQYTSYEILTATEGT
jgi:hypothetical protein